MSNGMFKGGRNNHKNFKPCYSGGAAKSLSEQVSRSARLFNGGSALAFMVARPKIRALFIQNECLEIVEQPALHAPGGAVLPGVVPGMIIESLFLTPEPPVTAAAVQATIDHNTLAAETAYDLIEQDIWNANHLGINAQQDLIRENDKGRTLAILAVQQGYDSIMARLQVAHGQWVKNRDDHRHKIANAVKVFNSSLGPDPLSYIRVDLLHGRYRLAWYRLVQHYTLNVNNGQNIAQVMTALTTAVYDGVKSVEEHITDMITQGTEIAEYGGHNIPDWMLREYILKSLKVSPHAVDYLEDINYIERHGSTLQEARDFFQTTTSNIQTANAINNSGATNNKKRKDREQSAGGKDQDEAVREIQMAANALGYEVSKQNKKVPTGNKMLCVHCQRKNHKSADCFKLITCGVCGRVGHPDNRCMQRRAAVVPAAVKKVSIGNALSGKN